MSGGSERVTVGYKYYLGIHMALCHGPIDKITQVQVDGRIAWEGLAEGGPITIDAPELFGGKSREGGVSGTVDIEMGGPDQAPNSYLQSVLGTDMPAFRGVTCAVLNQVYTGNNPYLKPWSFTAQRIHTRMDGQDQWYDSYSEIPRPNSDGTSTAAECLPYDCTAFEDYILTDSGADFYGIFANNKPDATSYLYNYNTVTAQNFSLEGSIGATTQYDTPVDRIAVCYDGAFYRQTNQHIYPVVPKSWTKDTYLSAGMVIISNAGNTGVKRMMGIKHGQNSGRFVVDYNYGTGDWTVDFTTGTDTVFAPISDGVPVLLYAAYDELTGNYFLRVNDTTQAGTVGTGSGSNFGTGFVDFTNAGDVTNNLDSTLIVAWIKEDDVDTSDLMYTEFLRSIEGYTVPAGCSPCPDMNPAHIIRECLTDPDWGIGYADADIDDTAFQSAADTLFTENMGISLLWSREMPIEDFIAEILRHIDAVLYVDRTTGKFVLSLIRGDYSESNLLLLDETNVAKIKDARRPTVGELTSSVTVNFWDGNTGETGSVIQHNQALIQVQGATKHTTIQYPGFTNNEVAQRVAIRDLTALSTSLLSCSITANREASTLNIGDPFILNWPDLAINSQVMRVQQLGLGDGRDNTIKIDAVEDVFATPAYLALGDGDVDTPWVDPTTLVPAAATPRLVTETPYYQLVLQSGETQVNNIIADDSDVGFLLTAGGRQGNELNARLHVDSGAGYSQFAYLDFAPYAYLSTAIGATDTQIYLTDGDDLDDVESGTIAQVGNELIRIDSLTEDSSGTFIMVGRGILDTVPAEHGTDSVGADSNSDNNRSDAVVFWGGSTASDNVQYTASDAIDVKMQTVIGSNVYPLATTPVDSVTMASRAYRPYPPGRLAIDGESYPEANSSSEIYWTGTHEISWTHRDRLQQTDGNLYDYTEGNIGPEAGTTYRIDIYSTLQNGTVTAPWWTVDGIATTSYSMDSNTDTSRGEPSPETDLIHVKVTSVRDGYESWQSPVATLSYVSDSAGFDSVGDSVGDSNNVDPYWGNVSLSIPFDGANGSQTFTDVSDNALSIAIAFGGPAISTTQSKFGGSSCDFAGSESIVVSDDAVLDFGSGDWTIEFWAYQTNQTGYQNAIAKRLTFDFSPYSIGITGGYLRPRVSKDGTTWAVDFTGTTQISASTWTHCAITREGDNVYTWVGGAADASAALTGTVMSNTSGVYIGAQSDGGGGYTGYIDDIRFTKGVARYTEAFTPPTAPFPTS